MRSISLADARRLVISSQHLADPRVTANKNGILQIIRDLGCIQIDPINIVAPSHQIVLWSRLGQYNLADFSQLMWEEHQLLEDWGHCTSIVPTTEYPIFKTLKREWKPAQKFQEWLTNNQKLRRYILSEIRQHGSLPTAHFKDKADVDWTSTGWTAGRNITQMLTYLWVLSELTSQGQIEQIQIINPTTQQPAQGTWYIHKTTLQLLDTIENGKWKGRTTLLSPFDNLIYERNRIEQLFNFKYRLEIYVPKENRQYGPYALPILFGDQFIGRINAKLNRETHQLEIKTIHSEPHAPRTKEVGEEIQTVLNQFATFLKAENIQYSKKIPKEWK